MSINLHYNQPLSIDPAKGMLAFDSNQHPMVLSEKELQALSPKHVFSVLEGRAKRLGEILNTPLFKLDPVIAAIDEKFDEAMMAYQKSLNEALGKDLKTIEQLEHEKKNEVAAQTAFWGVIGGGGGVVLTGAIGPAFLIACSFGMISYLYASNKREVFIKSEGKAFRQAWLHKVECLEGERIKEAQGLLKNRAYALYDHLKAQNRSSFINIEEWTYLGQILRSLQYLNVEDNSKLKKIQDLYQNLTHHYPALEKMES